MAREFAAPLVGGKAALADAIFEVGAVEFRPEMYRLKLHERQPDAPLSPVYLNLRTPEHPKNPGPLTPEIMSMVGIQFVAHAAGIIEADCFADIPEAGSPFGDAFLAALGGDHVLRRLFLEKRFRDDGTRDISELIRGDFSKGDNCLLVDEMITQADTKLEAAEALRDNGLEVTDVLLLVDRGQGGREQLAAHGIQLHAVLTLREMMGHYVARGLMSAEKQAEVVAYLVANTISV